MKEGYVCKSADAGPDAREMALINRYTRREYAPEEVYAFSLVLCDNEIDRDNERFSVEALEKLAELFVGKTCILDHERKSANQTARIFSTAVEREEGRLTRAGETYTRLSARAYLPRTEKNRDTIALIEGGILKEISVSCAVKRSVCSICGKEECGHRKGKDYGGRPCCRVLEEPTDAYECSFVAVPAQREAGVRKGWSPESGDVLARVKAQGSEGLRLSAEEAGRLRERLDELEEKAAWGERYRGDLQADILRWAGMLQPELPRDVMKSAMRNLSLAELSRLGKAYQAMAGRTMPLQPQLAAQPLPQEETGPENSPYRI